MTPPTFSVDPPARVRVPPIALLLAVKLKRSSTPVVTVRSPFMLRFAEGEALPPDLSTVRLLNVVAPIDWEPNPLNTTVPLLGVNVPVLVQLPPTEIVEEFPFRFVPTSIVTFPATVSGAPTRNVTPVDSVRFPLTVPELERVAVPDDLLMERLLYETPPATIWAPDPLKVIVPDPPENDPLVKLKSPLTFRFPDPFQETDASPDWKSEPATVAVPDPIVRLIACPFVPSLRTMSPPTVIV